jgi:uroporphyrinogen-III synthase
MSRVLRPAAFRVLITRPAEDAVPLATRLAALGIGSLIEPMLRIALIDGPPPTLDDVQALLVTSANGARAFAARSADRGVPVFAVGDASAAAARAVGFARVESAAGDVATLAALVRDRLDPAAGALLHVAGSTVAGELGATLGAAGFVYRRAVLYRAETAQALTAATVEALAQHALDAVALYSPRTAATFARLACRAGLGDACRGLVAVCLSEAVAAEAQALPWRAVWVSASPDQEALIAVVLAARTAAPGPQR